MAALKGLCDARAMTTLGALALNCTLKPSPAKSSCELLLSHVLSNLSGHDIEGEVLRVVDFDVRPGVSSDEGEGDEWPELRSRILEADILVLGTPIWMGHPSSVCQRVLERCDAFLAETDARGRMISYDRVAGVAVVGNEDGAHHVFAELAPGPERCRLHRPGRGLDLLGRRGHAGRGLQRQAATPEKTAQSAATLARNLAHLARALKTDGYPAWT